MFSIRGSSARVATGVDDTDVTGDADNGEGGKTRVLGCDTGCGTGCGMGGGAGGMS